MIFKIINLNEIHIYIHKTALFTAVEKGNIEIIKLLLTNEKIEVDTLSVFIILFIKFKFK